MPDPHAALITQLKNIQARTGQRIEALAAAAAASGAVKHADRRSWLMQQHGLGYGDANTVAHFVDKPVPDLGSAGPPAWAAGAVGATAAPAADVLDTLYTGPKAHLRPLHAAVLAAVRDFGSFEEAPKKNYVSLRRSKQFAMVGPATKDSVEIGLNARDLPPHPRLKPLPPGGMCQATTRISTLAEVDADLIGWLRQAYAAAG